MNTEEMKDMSYYVVEVSFNSQNPIHRAICFHRVGNNIDLHGSYEDMISTTIPSLAYFRVVEELVSMNIKKYPNCWKLPKDAERSFEYKGLHFEGIRRLSLKERKNVSDWTINSMLTPNGWDYQDFYEHAKKADCNAYDLFMFEGKVVLPGEKCLFEFTKKI